MRIAPLCCTLLVFACTQVSSAQTSSSQTKVAPAEVESSALREARHSFLLVATRAAALFRSADTIQASLEAQGSTLRPSTLALRFRIEQMLDRAEATLNKSDATSAAEQIKIAEELVRRFERRIGAE